MAIGHHLDLDLVGEYQARTPGSREYYQQACCYLPGGETRAVTQYEPYPVVLAEGHGALVNDVDGNEYVDVLNNYTALVHGHAFGPVVEAVQAALPAGTAFPAPHPAQLRLARMLTERYPAVDRVRFTNSGTEAALLALRIVRAATGRRRVVLFTGGYHGTVPEIIDGGPDTARVPYNDAGQAAAAIDSSVAAVFAEPSSAARPGSLNCSGTFNGNVITMTAGAAALAALDGPAIAALNERAAALAAQVEAAASRAAIPCSVTRAGSILHVHLLGSAPASAAAADAVPAAWMSALHLALLLEGIYTAPRGMLGLSTALDEGLLARVADGYARAFLRIRDLVAGSGLMTAGSR